MTNIPEIFKYNSLLSVPLFSVIALLLIWKTPHFSLHKHTISKTINFLNHPIQEIIFRLNFIVKALLDLGFALYILKRFNLPLESPIAITLFLSAFFFGTLAYFIEGKHSISHQIITYSSGVLWVTGQILIARLTENTIFISFSIICLFVPILLGLGFLFAKKVTVVVQAICMTIWYFWLLLFVSLYL